MNLGQVHGNRESLRQRVEEREATGNPYSGACRLASSRVIKCYGTILAISNDGDVAEVLADEVVVFGHERLRAIDDVVHHLVD